MRKGAAMDYGELTIEDCIRKLEQEGKAAVIEDGYVTGFVEVKKNALARGPV